jgi:hypothetical protein
VSHFTEVFDVEKSVLDKYGAFDISLLSDLPLFIDPFLLFSSEKDEYQKLHDEIIKYLKFLRDKSVAGKGTATGLKRWYMFSEVKQNWLGYTVLGNGGSALGPAFAKALNESLGKIFTDIGDEEVTKSAHLEKVCLLGRGPDSDRGVGKDNISDFVVNLIKHYFLEYTEKFAVENIDPSLRKKVSVPKAYFDYKYERWMPKQYDLPFYDIDFVLLTPKDMLTREDTWINRKDMIDDFYLIPPAIENDELREAVESYFMSKLPEDPKRPDEKAAATSTITKFPKLIDYYIKYKEDGSAHATQLSEELVEETEEWFVDNAKIAVAELAASEFYKQPFNSYEETIKRAEFFKAAIENNEVYKCFYAIDGRPITKEEHAQRLFALVWYQTIFDFNREVNNGRGPVDAKVSFGSIDKTLVEFKLASNSHLKHGFEKQIPVYEAANNTNQTVKIIICFNAQEREKVNNLLNILGLTGRKDIIVIDADDTNKESASVAK